LLCDEALFGRIFCFTKNSGLPEGGTLFFAASFPLFLAPVCACVCGPAVGAQASPGRSTAALGTRVHAGGLPPVFSPAYGTGNMNHLPNNVSRLEIKSLKRAI
jgi:hypothetical protein